MGFGEFVQSNIKKSDDSNCSCYSKFEVLTETCLSLPSPGIRDTFYIVYFFLNYRVAPYFMTYKTNVCFLLLISVCSRQTFWWYWGLNSQPWVGLPHSTTELWSQRYLLCLVCIDTFFSCNAFYF